MKDEEHAAVLREKANELCLLANRAAEDGLHVTINIVPYAHTHSKRGNIGSGFKALVLIHRECHI